MYCRRKENLFSENLLCVRNFIIFILIFIIILLGEYYCFYLIDFKIKIWKGILMCLKLYGNKMIELIFFVYIILFFRIIDFFF